MLVLVGKTASGKSSIQKALVEYGLEVVTTYTTRPPRKGEVDGVDYHFISEYDFVQKHSEGFFVETTSYEVDSGDVWLYGTAVKDLVSTVNETDNKVIVLNPNGLDKLRGRDDVKMTSFYIKTDRGVIWDRLVKRGDNLNEAVRRMDADEDDFKDVSNKVDFVFTNNGELKVPLLAEMIKYTYEKATKGE